MAYCTQADIEKLIPAQELAELTTESGGTPDADVVTECIAKADAEIDSYLGVKYTVPFSSAPARVESLSQDIAIYYLFTRRFGGSGNAGDQLQERYCLPAGRGGRQGSVDRRLN